LLNDDELISAHEGVLSQMEDMTGAGTDARRSFKKLADVLNAELERRGLPF
jgi:hypothetical protein